MNPLVLLGAGIALWVGARQFPPRAIAAAVKATLREFQTQREHRLQPARSKEPNDRDNTQPSR